MRRQLLRGTAAGMLATGATTVLMSQRVHSATPAQAVLYVGDELARYGFPDGHPLGADRQGAFYREAAAQGLLEKVPVRAPRVAMSGEIERFHSKRYVEKVMHAERDRLEYLDNGDTPVFPGVYRASATVVGSALDGLARIMARECVRTFQPIGGLHHARRDHAAGFCVFNDLGVVIETLRSRYGVRRVAYVDIDVHHGDGIFYPFEDDRDLIFADIHEDGNHLYPGTGREDETGKGAAKGTKLNIPLAPRSGDREFMQVWPWVAAHLTRFEPEFVVFQCGADGLKGDPLAHLEYSPATHGHAAQSLVQIARRFSKGRLMAFGGGGYDRNNLAKAWSAVLREIA
ncbi:MAG TPA: acetoin utilization protein AcuC [Burkholderiales bacterium]|jgi:acetoin utilization protein AcuC|nr:acetoin utilization protein AcuC [Burkholderiales bacterium]